MTEPGMEAVLADLMAEHDVKGDQATTGKGDPLVWPKPCLRCGSRWHTDCYAHVCGRDCPPVGTDD